MFKKAKKRAVRNMLLVSLLLALLAGFFLMMGSLGFVQVLQGPSSAAAFDGYDLKGKYVQAPMDWTLGSFVEYTQTKDNIESITAADYLVQLENSCWIAVRLSADKIAQADDLIEQCDRIIDGSSEDWPLGFLIQGTVIPMEAEDVHYLRSDMVENELIPGCYGDGELLHLVLVDGEVGITGNSSPVAEACATAFLALILLIITVILPIWGGKSLWKRDLVRYCKKTASPESTFEQLEAFADATPDTGLVKIGNRWLLVSTSTMLRVLETSHVVWAYQNVTNHKLYGLITISKSHAACLATDNGKIYTIYGKKQKVEDTLKGLYKHTDHIMIGYDPLLVEMYQSREYQGLLELAKQIREKAPEV